MPEYPDPSVECGRGLRPLAVPYGGQPGAAAQQYFFLFARDGVERRKGRVKAARGHSWLPTGPVGVKQSKFRGCKRFISLRRLLDEIPPECDKNKNKKHQTKKVSFWFFLFFVSLKRRHICCPPSYQLLCRAGGRARGNDAPQQCSEPQLPPSREEALPDARKRSPRCRPAPGSGAQPSRVRSLRRAGERADTKAKLPGSPPQLQRGLWEILGHLSREKTRLRTWDA